MNYDSTKARLTPNSAEYQRVHKWVIKQVGKADHCSMDRTHRASRYDWSNKSRNYLMDLSDWQQVCRACHRKHDGITQAGRDSISRKNRINSLGNTSGCKPVLMVFPNGSWIKYPSSKIASDKTGIICTAISNVLRGDTKTAGGFQWRRVAS